MANYEEVNVIIVVIVDTYILCILNKISLVVYRSNAILSVECC